MVLYYHNYKFLIYFILITYVRIWNMAHVGTLIFSIIYPLDLLIFILRIL